jgi:hypothetical protein
MIELGEEQDEEDEIARTEKCHELAALWAYLGIIIIPSF